MSLSLDQSTHVFIASSKSAAITHMAGHRHSFPNPGRLWFFYYGHLPTQTEIVSILPSLHKKKIILLHEDDLLGKIAAIKIACWLKEREVQITYQKSELIKIHFNSKTYHFPEHKLSLNRFEKLSGLRSQIKTWKIHL
jgi:hypothetical protein